MTQLSTALDAELRKQNPLLFGAIAIDLPGAQVNLLDGAGVVTFGGRNFVGRDPTYGTLLAIDEFGDGMGDDAPGFTLTLNPASDSAAADLAAAGMQGSPVYVWIGAINPATGLAVPDPYLLAVGELDVPTLKIEDDGRTLDYDVVSTFERFFDNDEGSRLSPAFHKSIWPDELGLDQVTGVTDTIFWGVQGANSGAISIGGITMTSVGGNGLWGQGIVS